MSAIGGLVQTEQPQIETKHLEAIQAALKIHGKDASGQRKSGHCGLVSNLLRITPEDHFESQPKTIGPFSIVADARIDNRGELGRKLGESVSTNPPKPDSFLILKSFLKWGDSCLDHIVGAFAFAIWNEQTRTLFLARDQRGEKTVYYHQSKDRFAFASMPKGLFALPWISRELDEGKLAAFLTLNHSNHATSFYKNIHRLPPAHFLKLSRSGLNLKRYWQLDLDARIELPSDGDYVEQGREILETCVRSAMRSAAPVGAMMSGGLDSSTVACTAARILQQEGKCLPTFTEVPRPGWPLPAPVPCKYCDESPYVKEIAAIHSGIQPHFVSGFERSFFDRFEERSNTLEMPYRNPFNQLWMEAICQVASNKGIHALLTGQTGNMSLSYDGLWAFPQLFKSLKWKTLLSNIKETSKTTGRSPSSLFKSKVLLPLCPQGLWRLRQKGKGPPAWETFSPINPDFAEATNLRVRNRATGHDGTFRVSSDSRVARAGATYNCDYTGDLNALFTSAFQVETRDPLGDIRLVQWCLSIPDSQYCQNGNTRSLMKRIAKPILPSRVLENQQRGIQAASWSGYMETQLPAIKKELELAAASPIVAKVLDLETLKKLAEQWPGAGSASSTDYRYKLGRGLVVSRFLRRL